MERVELGEGGDRSFDVDEKAAELSDVTPLVKVHFVGEEGVEQSRQQPLDDPERTAFKSVDALAPPFETLTLCRLYEMSAALRPNVDAYITNIDLFGHTFTPTIDLTSDDAAEQIRNAMFVDRQTEAEEKGQDSTKVAMPTDEQVKERTESLKREMRAELTKVRSLFDTCCIDESFTALRGKLRQDLEVMGNAYAEVLRNRRGQVALFDYIPAFTVRLMPADKKITEADVRVRNSELSFRGEKVARRFRRLVQIVEGRKVFFKQFGDPRTLSSQSGKYYPDDDTLRKDEGRDAKPATELLHLKIHSPRTPYGVPRWIGTLVSVMGSRSSEEVNFLYFDNKSIPPLVVTVSGGRLSTSGEDKLRSVIQNEIKGKRNFHRILILEAEPIGSKGTENAGRIKIDIKPLTQAQQSDGLFQKYDERNTDKVGSQFRLPRMLRGDIRDFNKGTAQAALLFAEMQVFEPERQSFDFVMNRRILNDLGIQFWLFKSQSPVTRDPVALSEMIGRLVTAGVLTPGEGRELAAEVFNREFRKIDAPWAKQPIKLTLADIQQTPGEGASGMESNPLAKLAKYLVEARDFMADAEAQAAHDAARGTLDATVERVGKAEAGEDGVIMLRVPADELAGWMKRESETRDD